MPLGEIRFNLDIPYFQVMEVEREKLFTMAIYSSYTYYRNYDFENAFKATSRASLLINNPSEQNDYLGKLMQVNGMYALICL